MDAILKHTDDDQDLSVFASGDELLFTCPRGHYWLLKAGDHRAESSADSFAEPPPTDMLAERFGDQAVQSLGLR